MDITHENITAFIKQWIAEELQNYKDLEELVNQGFCADLASNISEYFGSSELIKFHSKDDPCHTWIEFDGRHYDMQNPNGVQNWQELTYFN